MEKSAYLLGMNCLTNSDRLRHLKCAIINQGGQAMEEKEKLELMIKGDYSIEDILEQSKRLDETIKEKIKRQE